MALRASRSLRVSRCSGDNRPWQHSRFRNSQSIVDVSIGIHVITAQQIATPFSKSNTQANKRVAHRSLVKKTTSWLEPSQSRQVWEASSCWPCHVATIKYANLSTSNPRRRCTAPSITRLRTNRRVRHARNIVVRSVKRSPIQSSNPITPNPRSLVMAPMVQGYGKVTFRRNAVHAKRRPITGRSNTTAQQHEGKNRSSPDMLQRRPHNLTADIP
mmetsp:Transcript_77850/g.137266  ORF Transcript_77850/g.137266 Transcript_77850/m.137266 type:complete len:215 (-) Transcript_77850:19-663(-)